MVIRVVLSLCLGCLCLGLCLGCLGLCLGLCCLCLCLSLCCMCLSLGLCNLCSLSLNLSLPVHHENLLRVQGSTLSSRLLLLVRLLLLLLLLLLHVCVVLFEKVNMHHVDVSDRLQLLLA